MTNAQANTTNRDILGLAGYDSRACMAGKFPKKNTYACKDKKRGKKGLRRVRMGSNGRRWMHIHTTNEKITNIGTNSRARHNFDRVCGAQNL